MLLLCDSFQLKSYSMKKKHFRAFACLISLISLISCQSHETDIDVEGEEKFPVSFAICLSEEVLPIPGTRAMPDFNMPEPEAVLSGTNPESEVKELSDLCKVIEYVVYDNSKPEGTLRHRCFTPTDDDFGIVYDSLPAGEYTLAFLAHSSVCEGLEERVMRFDKVSDTFLDTLRLKVQRGAQVNEHVVLKRVVSKIEFVAKDTVPAGVKTFCVSSHPSYDKLNILTGQAVLKDFTYSLSHTFTAAERGKTGLRFAFLTFVPSADASSLDVTLITKDALDKEIYQQKVSAVRPLVNRVVRYSGSLFTPPDSDNTFPIEIDDEGKWGEPDEHELPE